MYLEQFCSPFATGATMTEAKPPYTLQFLQQLVKSKLVEIVIQLQHQNDALFKEAVKLRKEKEYLQHSSEYDKKMVDREFERANEEITRLRTTIANLAIEQYAEKQRPYSR